MGYLGAALTQVFTRAGRADVSLRDVTIGQMGNGARECGWRHAPGARGGFCGFWKSQFSWELDSEREESTFGARWGETNLRAKGVARDRGGGGVRWKSHNRKNVYLSPYVEEPLNSKVIKCFIPELRSCTCFSCFGIPMFYVYMLWTFYVRFTYPYYGYGTALYDK